MLARAVNTVSLINDGCTLHESFRQAGEGGLIGSSISGYDTRTETWQQIWMDSQGSVMQFTGGTADGAPTFGRNFQARDGRMIHQRMRFVEIKLNSFVWLWERSLDEGKSWQTMWKIDYVRDQTP